MIFLKFSEPHELNACNSFVRHNLVSKNICFLPSCLDNFDKDEIEEEKEEEVIGEESEESSSDSYNPEDDEEEYVGRPLTEDEIEAICRNYGNCDDCPLYNYCDEEMM